MLLKLYCYSHKEFDELMRWLGWENSPDIGNSTISISSKIDENPKHWFYDVERNINLDFNDMTPENWWDKDYYDAAFDSFINYDEDLEDDFFNFNIDNISLHAMNYKEAFKLVKFIDEAIKRGDNIYIHCSAGASRSQGVVRYILDTYYDIDWETRKDNPCLTPNWHVVRMLKRSYRYMIENGEL